jgi:Ca-activated chloride channel family protein
MPKLFSKPYLCAAFLLCFSFAVIGPGSQAYGQTVSDERSGTTTTRERDLPLIRSDVQLVLVPVTITNARNQPVIGLGLKDFKVYEDKQPQEIKYFFNEDAPLSIGLVLDFSGSMEPKIDALRESVRQFFNSAHPDDEYFVVVVSDVAKAVVIGSQSIREIETKLSHEQPVGGTPLLDGVEMTMHLMRTARYKRRAMVVVSDGNDNASRASIMRVVKEVEESDMDVYAVGIFDAPLGFFKPLDIALGKRVLTRLTDATGGRTVVVENAAQVPKVFSDLSLELRSQYVLGYRPPNGIHNGIWRKIKVQLAPPRDKGQFQANYRKGYIWTKD